MLNVLSYYSGYSTYNDMLLSTYIVSIIVGLVVSCIFGAITKSINESKGYDGGFAWGFWLGMIGIIVVACKQPNPYYARPRESIIRNPPKDEMPPPGGWKCTCGRGHAAYESSCVCGVNKSNLLRKANNEDSTEKANISALKEYKELLDQGIITQEEFDRKKQDILFKK